jgi:hypothetical protein
MATIRACRSFRIAPSPPWTSRLQLAPPSGEVDAQLLVALAQIVATVTPATSSGGSSTDAVSSRGSLQGWPAGPSCDRFCDGGLEGPRFDPVSSSSRSAAEYSSGREAQSEGSQAVANSSSQSRASCDSTPGLHNSRMKLTVCLAAQRALRPRCLRRLPAPYASVKHTGGSTSRTHEWIP